jgi:hypothetical protein
MKKRSLYVLIALIIAPVGFFLSKTSTVEAAYFVNQISDAGGDGGWYGVGNCSLTGSFISAISGQAGVMHFPGFVSFDGGSLYLGLFSGDGATLLGYSTYGSSGDYDFTASNINLLASNQYIVVGYNNIGYFHGYAPGGNSFSVGSTGSVRTYNNCSAPLNLTGSSGGFYQASISDAYIPPTISFDYPPNESSLGGDFTNWRLLTNAHGNTIFGTEKVIYGYTTSTMNFYDWQGIGMIGNTTSTDYLLKGTRLLNKPIVYAQAQLLDSSSTIIANSAIISFDTTGNMTNYTGACVEYSHGFLYQVIQR